jgi:hypothetical protein
MLQLEWLLAYLQLGADSQTEICSKIGVVWRQWLY